MIADDILRGVEMQREAKRILDEIREFHFPVSKDGQVHPGSQEAQRRSKRGIEECNFEIFSTGLHVLQDSWSHQGKPFFKGMGHGRGVWRYQWRQGSKVTYGKWHILHGPEAAMSDTADTVEYWQGDVRAMGMAVYKMMLDFKKACPCACPGPKGKKAATSSGSPKSEKSVEEDLLKEYPQANVVKG
jgi:hypothetical protein